jgi:hypothetical protein
LISNWNGWCPGAEQQIKPNQQLNLKWDSQTFPYDHLLSAANVPPPSDLVLGVKVKILTVDLSHEFRAKFDSLFELLFGLARNRGSVPQASDARDAAINLRE